MSLKIIVDNPTIVKKSKIGANIKCDSINAISEISIDFKSLHPFANSVNKKTLDLFFLASFVYGIDRFIERHSYSIDGWTREFDVVLPVYELNDWNLVKEDFEKLLSFLTGDIWEINFVKNNLIIPTFEKLDRYEELFTQVNLFSGGLDSLIGALDFLSDNPKEKLLLVSHIDGHISARIEQEALKKLLSDNFSNQFDFIPSVNVSLSKTNIEKEKTFRSRSLLFVSIAVILADYKKIPVCIPENGTVSLNFPLSSSRRSACSTRTTHPTFIYAVQNLLNKIGLNINLKNPYDLNTKGEMVTNCKNLDLLTSIINQSNSCGKGGHTVNWIYKGNGESHCGVCMPCIYRQASLQNIIDATKYGNTINKEYTGRTRRTPFLKSKQGQDFNACLEFLNETFSDIEIRNELLINGVKNLEKLEDYVDLVKRSRKELSSWINKTGSPYIKTKAGII